MPFDSSRTPDIFRIQLDTFFSLSLLFSSLFNSTSERVVDAKERERFRGKEMIRHEDNQDLTDYEGWSIPSGSVGSRIERPLSFLSNERGRRLDALLRPTIESFLLSAWMINSDQISSWISSFPVEYFSHS